MRPSTTTTLAVALSISSLVAAASDAHDGGSIQALLDRYSAKTHKGVPVDTLPDFLKPNLTEEARSKTTTVFVVSHDAKTKATKADSSSQASATKLVKRKKDAKNKRDVKSSRVGGQESSPSHGLDGVQPDLFSGHVTALPVNTPTGVASSSHATKAAIVILPLEGDSDSHAGEASRHAYNPAKAHHNRRNDFSHDNRKRWVRPHPSVENEEETSTKAAAATVSPVIRGKILAASQTSVSARSAVTQPSAKSSTSAPHATSTASPYDAGAAARSSQASALWSSVSSSISASLRAASSSASAARAARTPPSSSASPSVSAVVHAANAPRIKPSSSTSPTATSSSSSSIRHFNGGRATTTQAQPALVRTHPSVFPSRLSLAKSRLEPTDRFGNPIIKREVFEDEEDCEEDDD